MPERWFEEKADSWSLASSLAILAHADGDFPRGRACTRETSAGEYKRHQAAAMVASGEWPSYEVTSESKKQPNHAGQVIDGHPTS
jgi:hypothetical protein